MYSCWLWTCMHGGRAASLAPPQHGGNRALELASTIFYAQIILAPTPSAARRPALGPGCGPAAARPHRAASASPCPPRRAGSLPTRRSKPPHGSTAKPLGHSTCAWDCQTASYPARCPPTASRHRSVSIRYRARGTVHWARILVHTSSRTGLPQDWAARRSLSVTQWASKRPGE
jgi:hypothetical protein